MITKYCKAPRSIDRVYKLKTNYKTYNAERYGTTIINVKDVIRFCNQTILWNMKYYGEKHDAISVTPFITIKALFLIFLP